ECELVVRRRQSDSRDDGRGGRAGEPESAAVGAPELEACQDVLPHWPFTPGLARHRFHSQARPERTSTVAAVTRFHSCDLGGEDEEAFCIAASGNNPDARTEADGLAGGRARYPLPERS